jgi:SAM-dependent methyltransferase
MLRFRVGGDLDLDRFLDTGRRAAAAIRDSIELRGDVLDFGCGCGRILHWLIRDCPEARLFGVDVDPDAIAWCRSNLQARFAVNAPQPPLGFPDASFDTIYAVSVLTHLDEPLQHAWIQEWRRILRPGGSLLVTYHGELTWNILPAPDAALVRAEGFLFCRSTKLRGICPDWYHTAFQSESWLRRALGAHFDRIQSQPGRFGYQDAVVAS